MACSCKEKAFKGGYKYFAIGNYGTCYGGKDTAAYDRMLRTKGDLADDCLSGNFYEECSSDDSKECSGGVDSVFVYSFKAYAPTQPTRKSRLFIGPKMFKIFHSFIHSFSQSFL